VRADQAAVFAGLTVPSSNGIVEGHVNRLKLIKRSMYGRAKFDLLRQRVLFSPESDKKSHDSSTEIDHKQQRKRAQKQSLKENGLNSHHTTCAISEVA
jgi:hypothetical protein